MDGSPGDYRRRTAGERPETPGDPNPELRDWQKNTWYGPAPVHSNPFDEPEDAPELRSARSENVNNHIGDFWNTAADGYSFSGKENQPGPAARNEKQTKRTGKRKSRKIAFAAAGALLVIVILLLRFVVFAVHDIRVKGVISVPGSEVIRISGIRNGDSILTLSEDDVRQRIESNSDMRRQIEFRYLEKQMPDKVVIGVREREFCCWLTHVGILYAMDKNLMVMYESEDMGLKPKLVEVKGLTIRSGAMQGSMLGQEIQLGSDAQKTADEQKEAFSALFLEMKVQGCTDAIEEVDFSNLSSILLVTREGFTVSLGNTDNVHAKLRALLLVQEELIKNGIHSGTITVVNPETPIYTPGNDTED